MIPTARCRSTPDSSSTTTAPIRTWSACSPRSGSRRSRRTCRSPSRVRRPASSTAAAASRGFFAQPRNLHAPGAVPPAARDHPLQSRGAGACSTTSGAEGWTLGELRADASLQRDVRLPLSVPMASAIWSSSFEGIRRVPGADARALHAQPRHAQRRRRIRPGACVAGGSRTLYPAS